MSEGVQGFVLFLIFAGLTIYMVYNEIKKAKEEAIAEQRRKKINEALGGVKGEIKRNETAFNQSRDDLNNSRTTNRDVLRRHGVIPDKNSEGEGQ